jgi:hypothetical protein
MHMLRFVTASVLLAVSVAGCQKSPQSPAPTSSNGTSKPVDQSVAAPPDTVPSSDAAIKPAPPPDSAPPVVTSQASPKELSKQQEATSMPLPGQVNNHSTPAPLDKK